MKNKFRNPKSPKEAFIEAEQFYKNAKETLAKSPIEYGAYQKPKLVKEASAMAYLAALRAIDGFLLAKGFHAKNLPTSIVEYEKAIDKIPYNGKLAESLEVAYQNLHILGYYRGGVGVEMIKEGFSKARYIINTLTKVNNQR